MIAEPSATDSAAAPVAEVTSRVLRGALYAVGAELLFASMGATIKVVVAELPHEMVVFFRNLFGLLLILPWLLRRGLGGLATPHFGSHLVRGLAGLAAMYCLFYSLAHVPLAEAVLMQLTAPLFVPLVAFLWLRERLAPAVATAILLGFVGVGLILRPGFRELSPVLMIALAGGAFVALAKTGIRRLSQSEPVARIVFYFALIATVVSAVPLAWTWQPPSSQAWGLLVLVGLLATGGQVLLTASLGFAPTAQIGPYAYTSVLFAAGYGWLFWGESLTLATALGALLVVASGVLTGRADPRRGAPAPPLSG